MSLETHKTCCRFCHNYCAFEVEVDFDAITGTARQSAIPVNVRRAAVAI